MSRTARCRSWEIAKTREQYGARRMADEWPSTVRGRGRVRGIWGLVAASAWIVDSSWRRRVKQRELNRRLEQLSRHFPQGHETSLAEVLKGFQQLRDALGEAARNG
ncbi:hypothetical protein DY245_19615 [Streptomyces inhibens]|uniref:Uncharacterized protein n=1 Tax=Streptomyces inhibens TaxID=2293571 RepID=A0A371Q1W0_STRIH|nr:hypothetical protein [Streptomyces inhibens]REK88716.1 hypothetical protein DY245_19615 [Streptomyces inhibens]